MEAGAHTGNGDRLKVVRWRNRKWLAPAIGLVLAGGLYFGLNRYRFRFVQSDTDLLRLLPKTEATVFSARVAVLRQSGYLKLLEGTKPGREKEYTHFVQQTGFDYAKDLNAIAGTVGDGQFWLALQGRFNWLKIQQYVSVNNGSCTDGQCRISTSTAQRALSMRMIQPDVMALSIGGDATGAEQIRPWQNSMTMASSAPAWVRPSHALLTNPAELPLGARIFAISLQSADSVVLSLQPSDVQGAAFAIAIDALFTNQPTAETARDQLERSTQMLKLEFARAHKQPQPDQLGWLLTSGSFQIVHQHLLGVWSVRKELLEFLQ